MIKFQYLIVITSCDIGQYVYCNCLLTRLWHQKLWKAFFIIYKGLSLKQIKKFFLEGEGLALNWQLQFFGPNFPQKSVAL